MLHLRIGTIGFRDSSAQGDPDSKIVICSVAAILRTEAADDDESRCDDKRKQEIMLLFPRWLVKFLHGFSSSHAFWCFAQSMQAA